MILSMPAIWPKISASLAQKLTPIFTLIVITIAEIVWAASHGYRFHGLIIGFVGFAILLALAFVYGVTSRSIPLSNIAFFAALWLAVSLAGGISTYISASWNYPLLDASFKQMDEALGFYWRASYDVVESAPWFSALLKVAYFSMLAQIVIAIIYLSSIGKPDRNYELWWAALIALTATSILSGLFPAAGTFEYYGVGLERAVHLAHFHQLRAGAVVEFSLETMQGIVTFPSYHVVLAVLLTYAFRRTGLFALACIANILMLVSTPIYGGHYLVDMIGGAVIALLSIWLVRRKASLGTIPDTERNDAA